MRMADFDHVEPGSVAEACALLAADPEGSVVFAGGTDILVYLKAREKRHRRLVSLQRIPALRQVELGTDGGLSIGAMVAVNTIARHQELRQRFRGIVDAARSLAAEQVRNQATVAGNLCMAVPSADMAPILLAHDARLRVVSPTGERSIPLREFFVGPRATVLTPTEVVVAIEVAAARDGAGDASLRQGGRASLSLPIASAAAVVELDGDTCVRAAIALGSVAPTPIRAEAAGDSLVGTELTAAAIARAGELASEAARPIDDLRASRAYRLELVKVLVRRVLQRAAERASGRRAE